jgi:FkbM family methyltransferase
MANPVLRNSGECCRGAPIGQEQRDRETGRLPGPNAIRRAREMRVVAGFLRRGMSNRAKETPTMKRLLRPLKKPLRAFMKARGPVAMILDRVFVDLHHAYENLDYEFATNGERRVLTLLRDVLGPEPTLFDVGANAGHWSLTAHHLFPMAVIHAFEIVPQTFVQLQEATRNYPAIHSHDFGLSDVNGHVPVFFSESRSTVATSVPNFADRFHSLDVKELSARVMAGDQFCDDNGLAGIDFLKIDVEGHEHRVLKGFDGMLQRSRIKVIQFEYGKINIDTHFLLKDFYDCLGGYGFRVGKIYPRFVDFGEYRHEREDFLGPNFLAVHESCDHAIWMLSGRGS